MKIELERRALRETYTIGRLYIDGSGFCDTLEDKVRPEGVKVYGETAIPAGTYKVLLTHSARFNRVLPLLVDVPMFSGIRIHPGNVAADTHGCILVGVNDVKGRISRSRETFNRLFKELQKADSITIEITNP
jgi:hypothetical protein